MKHVAIDKSNYESWFLDYHEGTLSAQERTLVEAFVQLHPELKDEFESFELIRLSSTPPSETFPGKEALKKNRLNASDFEKFMLRKLEHELNESDLELLEDFISSHPEYKRDALLFELTRLKPDYDIVFENKKRLKKPVPMYASRNQKAFYFTLAAAASVIVLLGVYFMNRQTVSQEIRAEKKEVTKETPHIQEEEQPNPSILKNVTRPGTEERNLAAVQKKSTGRANQKQMQDVPKPSVESIADHQENLAAVKTGNEEESTQKNEAPATVVNPSIIKDALLSELESSPGRFNPREFDALLDRAADPDSTFSESEILKPVFTIAPSANQASTANPKNESTPLLNALAWGLSKITDDVKLKKNYNSDGELIAYSMEAGKLKLGNAK